MATPARGPAVSLPSCPTAASTPGLESDACYLALKAHDARFDGWFFTGVTSTGIYCRPVCRVKLPRRENCRFFRHAAQAEARGLPPLPALPARTGAARRQLVDRRRLAHPRAAGRAPDRRARCLGRGRPRRSPHRRAAGRERPPPAPHLRDAVRRLAAAVPADAPAAGGQAADRRHPAADDAGGAGQRLRERAPLQRRLRRRTTASIRARCAAPAAATAARARPVEVRLGFRPPYDSAGDAGLLRAARAGRRRGADRRRWRGAVRAHAARRRRAAACTPAGCSFASTREREQACCCASAIRWPRCCRS